MLAPKRPKLQGRRRLSHQRGLGLEDLAPDLHDEISDVVHPGCDIFTGECSELPILLRRLTETFGSRHYGDV